MTDVHKWPMLKIHSLSDIRDTAGELTPSPYSAVVELNGHQIDVISLELKLSADELITATIQFECAVDIQIPALLIVQQPLDRIDAAS